MNWPNTRNTCKAVRNNFQPPFRKVPCKGNPIKIPAGIVRRGSPFDNYMLNRLFTIKNQLMKRLLTLIVSSIFLVLSLSAQVNSANPAAEGFNLKDSDSKAVKLADKVMKAMGGWQNWNDTRYIQWNFFGARKLLWDKHKSRVRIESARDSMVYIVNLTDGSGKVFRKGVEMTNADSLAKYLPRGRSIWINDSYWLTMPFKLKDSGVTLKYEGKGKTSAGAGAEILQLTFDHVGDTPQNKYLVYVDPKTNLVVQWDYFQNATDAEPRMSTPWADYRQYGGIKLSGNRGKRELSDIATPGKVDEKLFEELRP